MKKNNITYYIYLFLGFFITFYIIYIRFFLIRLPKDLHFNLEDEYFNAKVVFVVFSTFICVYIIFQNAILIKNTPLKENNITFFTNLYLKVIENSLKHFFTFFMSFFKNNYEILEKLCTSFYNTFSIYTEATFIFISFFVRFFIFFVFFIDVFVFFKLDYFYKVLILLGIPLSINVFIYILRDFSSNKEKLQDILIIQDLGIDIATSLPITKYSLKDAYKDNDLKYIIEQYILCNKLAGYLELYDKYSRFFNPRLNIILYLLYLICWIFILIFNFLLP